MDKKALRKKIKDLQKELTAEYKEGASKTIAEKVLASKEFDEATTVFTFLSMDGEPETRKIIEKAWAREKRVCIPLCISDFEMEAIEIHSFDDLVPGAFGILEPKSDLKKVDPEELDLILMPCVTCNYKGLRLGHGRGYYDRFIKDLDCDKIVLCYDKLVVCEIPTDEFDICADRVITEKY